MKKTILMMLAVTFLSLALVSPQMPIAAWTAENPETAGNSPSLVAAAAPDAMAKLSSIKSVYPKGTYFNRFKYAPCNCHNGHCSYYGGCDCKSFHSAIQCKGFAGYVIYNMFGVYLPTYSNTSPYKLNASADVRAVGILGYGSVSEAALKKLFISARTGDAIQAKSRYSQHTMIYEYRTATGIFVYEGNYGGKCRVNEREVSYASLASTYYWGLSLNTAVNYKYAYARPGKPVLSINKTRFVSGETTRISWQATTLTTSYTISITKNGTSFLTQKLTGTSYSRAFTPGKYSAVVRASNAVSSTYSSRIYFDVYSSITP